MWECGARLRSQLTHKNCYFYITLWALCVIEASVFSEEVAFGKKRGVCVKERETKTEVEKARESEMMVSVAGRFLAMHISILPIKDLLNLSEGVGGLCYWLLLHCLMERKASQRESERATETEKKRMEGWKTESWSGRWGGRKEGTAGLRLNIVNLKDSGQEI